MIRWLRFCVTDAGVSLIKICDDELSKLGRENQKSFLLYTLNMMRQVVLLKEGMHQLVHLPSAELNFVQKFAKHYQLTQIDAAIRLFEEAYYHIERNANPKILFLDVSLQLVLIYKYQTFRQLTDSTYTDHYGM